MQPLLMRWRCTTGGILLRRRRRRMLPSSSSSSSSSSTCNPNKFSLSVIIGSDTPSESSSSSSSHLPMLSSSSSSKFSHNKSNLLRGNKNTLVVFSKSLSGGGPRNHRAYSSSVSGIMQEHADTVDEENNLLVVVSFYKFADFPDHADMRKPLKDLCQELRVSGGIILAPEGINGSICGSRESVEAVLRFIQSDNRLNGLRRIESPVSPEEEAIHHHGHTSTSPLGAGEDAPFRWDHVRVKLKKEIVSLGLPTVSPMERVGKYVNPRDWNALINDPDTVVIDVRNNYETRIGKFRGAVDPCTVAFREFPSWVDDNLEVGGGGRSELNKVEDVKEEEECNGEVQEKKPARVAMYCTGGIRCEKASSFLLSKGVKEVYHLEGGILKYLEEIPKEESMWEGECFVFDKRVSVEHGLGQGTFKLCYGCKQPVSDVDMESPLWEYGVSCPYCFSTTSQQEKDRARARQTQFQTWGVIGGPHKGRRPPPPKPTPAGGDNNVTDYQRMGG